MNVIHLFCSNFVLVYTLDAINSILLQMWVWDWNELPYCNICNLFAEKNVSVICTTYEDGDVKLWNFQYKCIEEMLKSHSFLIAENIPLRFSQANLLT